MDEIFDNQFESEEMLAVVHRYEDMKKNNKTYYFDVFEFENIIDFYVSNDRVNSAYEVTKYAIKQHPTAVSIQLKRAQLLIDKGLPSRSLSILDKIEKIESENLNVYVSKGIAYYLLGNQAEANRHFDIAISLASDFKDQILYGIALFFEQTRNWNLAIKYLLSSYVTNKDNFDIYFDLAYCYEKIDEDARSILLYKKYLEQNPYSENAWYNLGVVYYKLSQYEEAISAYDYCVALNPEYSSALFNKANSYNALEDYDRAIEIYQEFLLLEKGDLLATYYLGECFERKKEYELALIYYREAIQIDQNFAEAWFGIGVVMSLKENFLLSLLFVYRAILLDNKNLDYWYSLAEVCQKIEFNEGAKKIYQIIIEIEPSEYEAYVAHSELLFSEGKRKDAIHLLENYLTKDIDNPLVNYQLAVYFNKINQKERAAQFFSTAIRIDFKLHEFFLEEYPELRKNRKIIETIKSIHQ